EPRGAEGIRCAVHAPPMQDGEPAAIRRELRMVETMLAGFHSRLPRRQFPCLCERKNQPRRSRSHVYLIRSILRRTEFVAPRVANARIAVAWSNIIKSRKIEG